MAIRKPDSQAFGCILYFYGNLISAENIVTRKLGLLLFFCLGGSVDFRTLFRSYLFGDVAIVEAEVQEGGNEGENDEIQQLNQANQVNPINLDGDLGAAHQALIQREGPTGFQPYNRPNLFPIRVSVKHFKCSGYLNTVNILKLERLIFKWLFSRLGQINKNSQI
jgi:hypothetical protein